MKRNDELVFGMRLFGPFTALLTLTALTTAPVSFAQDQGAADEDAPANIEEITVTGSRIPRAGVDTFYPAVSMSTEELDDNAFTNVADALNEIPAFSQATAVIPQGVQNTFSVGQNFVDFLGLGTQRTLTLVNGKRFVSANAPSVFGQAGGLQVDFNVIPLALVERVEVIGVGGAPIYGADAIAGTINVIMRDRFEGVELGYQFGPTEEGDGDVYKASILAGTNFADGRGNVTFSAETYSQDALKRTARPYYTDGQPFFATDTLTGDGVQRIFRDQRINIFTFGGLVAPADPCPVVNFAPNPCTIPSFGIGAFPDGNFYQFDSNSNLVPFTPGQPGPGSFFFALGGDGEDFFDEVNQLQSPLTRDVFTGSMNYDITDNVRVYSSLLYANTEATELTNQGGFQTFAFGGTSGALVLPADHPLLPQQAQDLFAANGMTQFSLHRFNNDVIDSSNFREQHLWRFVGGLQGDFELAERQFNWEAYAVRGESDGQTRREGIIDDRFLNAIDARVLTAADLAAAPESTILAFSGTATAGVGDVVCEAAYQAAIGTLTGTSGSGITDSDLPFVQGCVPLNLFGEGARSEAARAWVTGTQLTDTDIEQTVYNVNFGGELLELPGGSLGFNVGYETREEEAVFQPALGSAVPLTRTAGILRTGGDYTTDEIFGEVVIPVVSSGMDIPFLDLIEINGAVREIDNSRAGSATVWTAGGRFSPVDDITFRGNYTESIRSPSLVELFAPITGSFTTANDPCDNRFVTDGPAPATREANCRAELGASYDPATFTSNVVNATAMGRTGGNPDLANELAEAYSLGVTLEPRWVDNLVITADYIDIQLTEAILALNLQQIMQACYDSASFPNVAACGSFMRDSSGQVVNFLTGQTNAQQFEVEFLNFGVSYGFDVSTPLGWLNNGWGGNELGFLTTRSRISNTRKRLVSVTGDPAQSMVGGFADPEYSGTFDVIWDYGDNTRVFWRLVWQSGAKLDPTGDNTFEDLDGNVITETDGRFFSTISASYNFGHLFNGGENDMVLQLTVDNAFDAKPDFYQLAAGHFTVNEMIGRRYTLGIRASF